MRGFGRDKAKHFGATAAIALAGYGGAALLGASSVRARSVAGAALALLAGVGKELYDLTGRGTPSLADLAWDLVGTGAGVSVAWSLER